MQGYVDRNLSSMSLLRRPETDNEADNTRKLRRSALRRNIFEEIACYELIDSTLLY